MFHRFPPFTTDFPWISPWLSQGSVIPCGSQELVAEYVEIPEKMAAVSRRCEASVARSRDIETSIILDINVYNVGIPEIAISMYIVICIIAIYLCLCMYIIAIIMVYIMVYIIDIENCYRMIYIYNIVLV